MPQLFDCEQCDICCIICDYSGMERFLARYWPDEACLPRVRYNGSVNKVPVLRKKTIVNDICLVFVGFAVLYNLLFANSPSAPFDPLTRVIHLLSKVNLTMKPLTRHARLASVYSLRPAFAHRFVLLFFFIFLSC